MAGSPTCLKVSTSGACEDLDMETEEEEDVRARGLNITKWHDNIYSMLLAQVIAVLCNNYTCIQMSFFGL